MLSEIKKIKKILKYKSNHILGMMLKNYLKPKGLERFLLSDITLNEIQ